MNVQIKSALISVYHKDGLEEIVRLLHHHDVTLYSTGGTWDYIYQLGLPVTKVEEITGYPSILDGRVKTLHPKIFGGILARRNENHLEQLVKYDIPLFDLVVVDLYPFEETVASTSDEDAIIEKIDIGGISLIRAAAKNYQDVVIVPSRLHYPYLLEKLKEGSGSLRLDERKYLAGEAFRLSAHYDHAIFSYLANEGQQEQYFQESIGKAVPLRYGENPHQSAVYFGDLDQDFHQLSGKELSFNNLVDIEAAISLIREFENSGPTFAVIKHTNACGVATRDTVMEAWKAALEADPVSAFGGILICSAAIDFATATEIDKIFYEVLIAPSFSEDALELLRMKPKRTLLRLNHGQAGHRVFKSLLSGVIVQEADSKLTNLSPDLVVTERHPDDREWEDLLFAEKCVKHLKSNTIVLVRDKQMLGMGCGQTSRIDACHQAIDKAAKMGFTLEGAVMASDAFFPFPDCVELAAGAGITAVIQPGGSLKDQLSIDFCNQHNVAMVCSGIRHFLH